MPFSKQHLFFDLDRTLWDFDKNSILAFEKIFAERHPTIDTNTFIEIYAPINQACWKLYQVDKMTHEELRYERLKQSFDALGYKISDDEIDRIAIDYIAFLPDNNQLFDGAIEVLEYLTSKYNLHIMPYLQSYYKLVPILEIYFLFFYSNKIYFTVIYFHFLMNLMRYNYPFVLKIQLI